MHRKKFFVALGTIALASTLVLAGCSSSAGSSGNKQTGNTIKLGGNFELSGAAAQYGQAMERGTKLAVEQINKDGGVKVGSKSRPSQWGDKTGGLITLKY